ncbi:MAG: replication initiation factor domain-containing protein [Leptospiraceae bacterium]|nr:replication initiation factor domain-containing protein [Leptospiraceae bacterium]
MQLPDKLLKTPFVDWLSFSVKYEEKSFKWIDSVFGDRTELNKGFNGYTNSFLTSLGALCGYSPQMPKNKIHVTLSSKALFNLNGIMSLSKMIKQIISLDGTFSRIDISQDDYDGYLHLPEILEKLKNQEVSTRFRGFLKVEAYNPEFIEYEKGSLFRDPKRQNSGQTIYIGDWHSDNFCRKYDKKKQTQAEYECWNRVEFQFRHKVANEFCNPTFRIDFETGEIKSFDGTFEDRSFAKTVYYYLKYITPSYKMIKNKDFGFCYLKEKHRRHWDVCSWWVNFLQAGEGQPIGLPKNETGLEEIKKWQIDQCSGADFLLMEVYGEKYSHEKYLAGKKKFENNPKYLNMLNEFKETGEYGIKLKQREKEKQNKLLYEIQEKNKIIQEEIF